MAVAADTLTNPINAYTLNSCGDGRRNPIPNDDSWKNAFNDCCIPPIVPRIPSGICSCMSCVTVTSNTHNPIRLAHTPKIRNIIARLYDET